MLLVYVTGVEVCVCVPQIFAATSAVKLSTGRVLQSQRFASYSTAV